MVYTREENPREEKVTQNRRKREIGREDCEQEGIDRVIVFRGSRGSIVRGRWEPMRDPEGEFRTRMATEGSHRNESLANGHVCTWYTRICTLIVLNRS